MLPISKNETIGLLTRARCDAEERELSIAASMEARLVSRVLLDLGLCPDGLLHIKVQALLSLGDTSIE